MDRRNFIRGLIAAPAIVTAAHIMPVRALELVMAPSFLTLDDYTERVIWHADRVMWPLIGHYKIVVANHVMSQTHSDGLAGLLIPPAGQADQPRRLQWPMILAT